MCFTVLTMPHWSSSEQLPVVLRDKRDVTLIYKKEICLYISVTSGDQLICSMPLGYHWFYMLTYPLFKTNSGLRELHLKIIIQWIHLYNSCDDDLLSVTRLEGKQLTDDLRQKQK